MNKNETILEQFRNIVPGVTPINKLRKRKIYVERDLGNETKCTTFLKEIVFKHLLGFVGDQTIQNSQLRIAALYPTSIGIENLIEHSLAQVGSYEFVNEKYRDFNDEDKNTEKLIIFDDIINLPKKQLTPEFAQKVKTEREQRLTEKETKREVSTT